MSFTLHTKDVLSTVTDILRSCSLPMGHMKGLKGSEVASKSVPEDGMSFYRPIKWDKSYYTFTGFRDPEQELQQSKRVEPTLRLVTLMVRCGWGYSEGIWRVLGKWSNVGSLEQ